MADYIVQKGDTLSKIAKAHSMTVKQLAELNGIKDVNKIMVGQKLIFEVENEANTETNGIEHTMSDEEVATRLAQQAEELQQLKSRTLSQQAKEEIQRDIDEIVEEMKEKYDATKEEIESLIQETREQLEKAYLQGVEAYRVTKEKVNNFVSEQLTAAKNSYNATVDNAESKAKDVATAGKEKARALHEGMRADVSAPEPEVDISNMSQEELLAYNDQLIQQLKNESLTGRAKREIKEKLDEVENTLKTKYNTVVDNAFDKVSGVYNKVANFVKGVFDFFRID